MMKPIFLLLLICCIPAAAVAQKNTPKWLEKQRKAVFTVTTYGKDNQTLHKGTGFFLTESGEAVSGYSIFKGAERAIVTDTDGNNYPVQSIIGADDLYDVIRFKVNTPKKITFFPLAPEPVANGSKVYVVPYSTDKKGTFAEGTITEVSKLKDSYAYYKTSVPFNKDNSLNAPLLNESGQVIGLIQEDATGNLEISHAASAAYIKSLHVTTVDALNSTYTQIGIRKAWPLDPSQAQVMLYLMSGSQDAATYVETLNDYVATFPTESEAYMSRASHLALNRIILASGRDTGRNYLDAAWSDFDKALSLSNDKASTLYNKARIIFDVATADTTLNDKNWTLASAMNTLQEAISLQDLPLYHQLEGDIYYTLGVYDMAYESYMQVNNSDMASSTSYYWAAKAKEQISGTNISELITLLDSAIVKTGSVPTQETLAYLLERVEYKMQLSLYEEAVKDYDLYYDMLGGNVGDSFYYYREQAKFRAGDFPGALTDIQKALQSAPDDPNYLAEQASVYIRMENYNDALNSVDKALSVAPDFASCYRLKGICNVRLGKNTEACEAFAKGKELGDPLVERLMREHCK